MATAGQGTGTPPPCQAFEAACRRDGAVVRGVAVTHAAAVQRRQAGSDVVVCGPDKGVNRSQAEAIERAANGVCQRHQYHPSTGLLGLPHWQPVTRPPAGHTFYEVDKRKAVSKP